ncbi:hypothetical protein CYMTET_46429, partial [Cymbomonas tetramitiformis]
MTIMALANLLATAAGHAYLHETASHLQRHRTDFGFSVVFFFDYRFRDLAINLVANMRLNGLTNEVAGTNDPDQCGYLDQAAKEHPVLCSTIERARHPEFDLKGLWLGSVNMRAFFTFW